MSDASSNKPVKASPSMMTLVVERRPDESEGSAMARAVLGPEARHALVAASFACKMLPGANDHSTLKDNSDFVRSKTALAKGGDLSMASEMLTAQAISLDAMFTEFSRRAAANVNEYLNAADRYSRLAMKAQANCRATLEALARLHQPREQTVRHVHVNEGGQAIVANQFHHHGGAGKNGVSNEQSHAPEKDRPADGRAALPRPDAERDGVPIAGGEREATLQDARRD